MYPTLFELQTPTGTVGMHTYGLFILLAFCGAFLYTHVRALRIGLHPDKLLGIYIAAFVGGLLGGRILYTLAVDLDRFLANPLVLFQPSGFAVYGGVIGGTIAVAILSFAQGIRPWKLADIAGPAVLIGMGVGRIGCFFAGCCHGAIAPHPHDATGLLPKSFEGGQIWLSSTFPYLTTEFASGTDTVSRITDTPLYPTQLWSVVLLLGLAALLAWGWEHKRFDGQIAALALILEPFYRISVESFRADERGYAFAIEVSDAVANWFPAGMTQAGEQLGSSLLGLTTSQAIGLGSMAFGIAIYAIRSGSGIDAEIPVSTEPEDDFDDDLLDDVLDDEPSDAQPSPSMPAARTDATWLALKAELDALPPEQQAERASASTQEARTLLLAAVGELQAAADVHGELAELLSRPHRRQNPAQKASLLERGDQLVLNGQQYLFEALPHAATAMYVAHGTPPPDWATRLERSGVQDGLEASLQVLAALQESLET
jgi:phosphatidylglycerol:prolipoprotein diacylglycerol transferase